MTADREYKTSKKVTENLTELIKQQELSLENYNSKSVKEYIAGLKEEKEVALKQLRLTVILKQLKTLDSRSAKALQLAQEKGCGAWLTVLP